MANTKGRKKQCYYKYAFLRNYESLLPKFLANSKQDDVLNSMWKTVSKSEIQLRFDDMNDVGEMMNFLESNMGVYITKTGLKISTIIYVIQKIFDHIFKEFSFGIFGGIVGFHRLQVLLNGGIVYEIYTKGKEGEKLIDLLNEENERGYGMILYFWNMLIAHYMKFVSFNMSLVSLYGRQTEIWKNIFLGKNIDKEEIREFVTKVLGNKKNKRFSYKFSNKGILLVKSRFDDESIIKGFQQIRIVEKPLSQIPNHEIQLYIDIISSLFFDEELYFYYSPLTLDIGICDKNHITLYNNSYVFLSFSNIVRTVFSENGINDGIEELKTKICDNAGNDTKLIQEILKKTTERLMNIRPDDFSLSIEGIVNDAGRYSEIKAKNPYGYTSLNGEGYSKKHVRFNNKHQLSKFKKTIIKKQSKQNNS